MSLHAMSVSLIRCSNEALKKFAPQKHQEVLQRSENRQVTRFIYYSFLPVD